MLINRKLFLKEVAALTGLSVISGELLADGLFLAKPKMQLGFVTYLWGKDWDVQTIIKNCTDTRIHGVELRVEHAHKVMPELNATERQEVKKKFADSPVKIVGLGTNQQYDYPDRLMLLDNPDAYQ